MKTTELRVLVPTDLERYRTDGYLLAKGVLPQALLEDCQSVLEQWVETMVAGWVAEGLLHNRHEELDFRTRYLTCWREAGQPAHQRSPRAELVRLNPEAMYAILRHPALLDLAQDLLGDDTIVSHGIWNSRPKAPAARFTDTPWHQDAQYFREQAGTHIVTIWFPLHAVDEASSCLAVARDWHGSTLYADQQDADGTGFLGLEKADAATLSTLPIAMEPGDALCFSEMMPHRAMPNTSDRMRWSMDTRFVSSATAKPAALTHGMLARCPADPTAETRYGEWLQKWSDNAGY